MTPFENNESEFVITPRKVLNWVVSIVIILAVLVALATGAVYGVKWVLNGLHQSAD